MQSKYPVQSETKENLSKKSPLLAAESAQTDIEIANSGIIIEGLLSAIFVWLLAILFCGFFSGFVSYFLKMSWAIPIVFTLLVSLPILFYGLYETFNFKKNFKFSLQKEFVFSRAGTIGPAFTLVPYENIQDVNINEGLVEKIVGASSIYISTPAGQTRVPFIAQKSEAENLRNLLLKKSESHRNLAE